MAEMEGREGLQGACVSCKKRRKSGGGEGLPRANIATRKFWKFLKGRGCRELPENSRNGRRGACVYAYVCMCVRVCMGVRACISARVCARVRVLTIMCFFTFAPRY